MTMRSALKQIVQSAYGWTKAALTGSQRGAERSGRVSSPAAAVTPAREPVEAATARRGPRPERRPGIRGEVLEAVRAAGADGATRADLLESLGVKGDPPREKAVSNALSSLKKSGALLHEGNRYMAA